MERDFFVPAGSLLAVNLFKYHTDLGDVVTSFWCVHSSMVGMYGSIK